MSNYHGQETQERYPFHSAAERRMADFILSILETPIGTLEFRLGI